MHWGMFSTSGEYHDTVGGYHEYIGGCSAHCGDTMSTSSFTVTASKRAHMNPVGFLNQSGKVCP